MKRDTILANVLFWINPILSIPFIIRGILRNNTSVWFVISLFMGLLAYLQVPYASMDIVRYYEYFRPSFGLYELSLLQNDSVFVFYVVKIMNLLSIDKQFLSFLGGFLSYFFMFKALSELYANRVQEGAYKHFIWFISLVVLFGISFSAGASGLRTGIAISMALYGTVRVLLKRKLGFLFLGLALFVHFLVFIYLLCFIASYKVKLGRLYRFLFIISPIIGFSGAGVLLVSLVFYSFADILMYLGMYRVSYVDGLWGTQFYDNRNLRTYIFEVFITPLPFYSAYCYLFFIKNKNLLRNIIYCLFFISFFFFDYRTLFLRYSYFSVLLFIIVVTYETFYVDRVLSNLKKYLLAIFLISCIIYSLGAIYKYRDMFLVSWGKVFYEPTIVLFMNKVTPNMYIIREE